MGWIVAGAVSGGLAGWWEGEGETGDGNVHHRTKNVTGEELRVSTVTDIRR